MNYVQIEVEQSKKASEWENILLSWDYEYGGLFPGTFTESYSIVIINTN